MVSSALQCRRRYGPLPGSPPADAVPWPCREGRRPRERSDRVPERGSLRPPQVRRGAREARYQERNAGRMLLQPGLRVVQEDGKTVVDSTNFQKIESRN